MKKTILTSIAAIAFAMPAIAANIPNDATCNSGVLGVSSGSANLEADYTANTINITWDGNGGSTPTGGASTCTYDSTFNLPAAPTRVGYTFAGWAAIVQLPQCGSLGFMEDYMTGSMYLHTINWDAQHCKWKPLNGEEGYTTQEAFGIETSSDLENGEWEWVIQPGTLKGISKCSITDGDYHQPGNPSDTPGGYCWCMFKTFIPNGGNECSIMPQQWYRDQDFGDLDLCISSCPSFCVGNA